MKTYIIAIVLLAMLYSALDSNAAERTIPAKTYDDVSGLPVINKSLHRDGATVNWFQTVCFVARTTTNQILPLKEPCAQCYGPDDAATIQQCRVKVRDNPDNGLQ